MEKDVIKKIHESVVCEECGNDIRPGSLVNEFREKGSKESKHYCMGCLPKLVVKVEWTRRRER